MSPHTCPCAVASSTDSVNFPRSPLESGSHVAAEAERRQASLERVNVVSVKQSSPCRSDRVNLHDESDTAAVGCRISRRAPVPVSEILPGLPDKRDQPVFDSLRIGVVAIQFSTQELFLEEDPQSEQTDGNARQHSSGG